MTQISLYLLNNRRNCHEKYIVCLTDQEHDELNSVIKKLKGTSQKVRRA